MSQYNYKDELKLKSSNYSFSEQMQKDAMNDFWRRKEGLWTLLSAACDDAAKQFYEHLDSYANDILDLETCNIHSLKSIAKSVDLNFLVKHIREDYPTDILKLINLLSIPRYILLNTNRILHDDANLKLFGSITKRGSQIFVDEVSLNLIYEIKLNVFNIGKMLKKFMFHESNKLSKVFKNNLPDLKIVYSNLEYINNGEMIGYPLDGANFPKTFTKEQEELDPINHVDSLEGGNYPYNSYYDFSYDPSKITLSEKFDNELVLQYHILNSSLNDIYQAIHNIPFTNLKYFTNQKLIVDTIDVNGKQKKVINHFYLLINMIKQNFYNKEGDFILDGTFYNDETNKEVDIRDLLTRIVSSIHTNDDAYLNDFIVFHFYNLIKEKLYNDNLKSLYERREFDKRYNRYNLTRDHFKMVDLKYSDYSESEFKEKLGDFISPDEIDEFIKINNISHYTKELVEFIEYLSFLNLRIFKDDDLINYDLLQINFPDRFNEDNTSETSLYERLFEGDDCLVRKLAKELSDIAVEISYLREEIKENVIRYGYIGTKSLVVNVLNDFYIKNFSNKKDWSFQTSNIKVDNTDELISGLLMPLTSYINTSNSSDKFSINLIEYYDTTDYLNIQSDLGYVKTGEAIIGYEDVEKWYLDSNNLITSSLVKEPIYQDVYSPCSLFVANFNQRFWEGLPQASYDNIFEYEQFLNQYQNINELNNNEKLVKINETKQLFAKIWDEFALSGFTGNETSDIACLFTKYIGTDAGDNKYLNYKNEIFPTIAPMQNIEGLVEISEFSSDILFVSKIYYSNVIESIKNATKSILEMYNNDGIPFENWKNSYIQFHGYSSKYTYSSKTNQFGEEDKNINIDGPWSYSDLQNLMYKKLSNELNDVEISSFIRYTRPNEESNFDLYSLYHDYILSSQLFDIDSEECINEYNIEKLEQDVFLNTYTLFKKKDQIFGKLFFRSYETTISLPIENDYTTYLNNNDIPLICDGFFEVDKGGNNSNISILKNICNKCVDFGIYEDYMWVFGYDETCFRLAVFKIDYRENHIYIVEDSLKYVSGSDSLNNRIEQLNDFIGTYKNLVENEIVFITCDFEKEIIKNSKLKDYDYDYNFLNKSNFNLYLIFINTITHEIRRQVLEVNDIVFPAVIDNEGDEGSLLNNHRIWNFKIVDGRNYICYESLNKSLIKDVGYDYCNASENSFNIEVLNIQWNIIKKEISNNDELNNVNNEPNNISISKYKVDTILFDSIGGTSEQIRENLSILVNTYPKCYFKNGFLNMDLIPFSFINDKRNVDLAINRISNEFNNPNYKYIVFDRGDVENQVDLTNILYDVEPSYLSGINNLNNFLSGVPTFNGEINTKNIDCSFDPSIDSKGNPNINSNYLYEEFPIVTRCLVDPLSIRIEYRNETGVDFVHEFALDVDATCYINDITEKNKKVGYGNRFKETSYISWSGDKQNEGFEEFTIDIEKYVNNKNQNKHINNKMEIVLNVCWNANSQLMNDNVYAVVKYRGVSKKILLDKIGVSEKSCENRSLVLNIDMNSKNLTYELPKRYFAIKVAKKRFMTELEDAIPDVQLGYIDLTSSEFNELNNEWDSKTNKDYLIYNNNKTDTGESGIISYTTILLKNAIVTNENVTILLKLIKNELSKLFFIMNEKRQINLSFKDLLINEIFFGLDIENIDIETNINYLYYAYFRKKYFEPYRHNHDLRKMIDNDKSFQLYVGMSPDLKNVFK
jgi:hypothetical protein